MPAATAKLPQGLGIKIGPTCQGIQRGRGGRGGIHSVIMLDTECMHASALVL